MILGLIENVDTIRSYRFVNFVRPTYVYAHGIFSHNAQMVSANQQVTSGVIHRLFYLWSDAN